MKVWIVCVLLCAAFTLRTAAAAAIEIEPEQNQKLPEEATELVVEKLIDAAEDKEEALRQNAVEDKSGYCPTGWFRHRTRCFLLVRSTLSWQNAEARCVAEQASLASVHNADEYKFLQSLLQIAGISQAWIGAYNFQGTWWWIDRARFSYTNWYTVSSVTSYPCGFMRSNVGWSNTNCANGYAYFCSIDPSIC
ncbi:ladderlectin-like isoform X1 [Pangasianodon hypophthalmus]|nr:ladderlectin-like isoform X1 [Pangasianodon hypophthalmus]XP_053088800.1 ladderlectin-like isoform X1 [Pangasianodon hypophthalmus]